MARPQQLIGFSITVIAHGNDRQPVVGGLPVQRLERVCCDEELDVLKADELPALGNGLEPPAQQSRV